MPRQLIIFLLLLSSCASSGNHVPDNLPANTGGYHKTGAPYQIAGHWYTPMQQAMHYDEQGIASWYGKDFHGKRTANGERYDMHAFSAAHKTLPLPTLVRVTNLDNGRSIIVRINDRGPFVKNRLIDLSYAAAQALGFADQGTAHVRVQTLDAESSSPAAGQHVPSPTGQFIQVGAFVSRDHARSLQRRLQPEFPSTHIRPPSGIGDLYRVRIGPVPNNRTTEQLIRALSRRGITHTIVVTP